MLLSDLEICSKTLQVYFYYDIAKNKIIIKSLFGIL